MDGVQKLNTTGSVTMTDGERLASIETKIDTLQCHVHGKQIEEIHKMLVGNGKLGFCSKVNILWCLSLLFGVQFVISLFVVSRAMLLKVFGA